MTDLLILWSWEHDADFLKVLKDACEARHVSVALVESHELPELPTSIQAGRVQARVVLDRVWDLGGEYARHCDAVTASGMLLVNDYERVRRAWHKPTMHYELIAHGLSAPYMLILPALEKQAVLDAMDLSILGSKFSIKGAHSGGSGVLQPATSWSEVLTRRMDWSHDDTLVQSWVEPQMLGSRRAWFRVFYACGVCYLCWADDQTHIQTPVSPAEEARYRLDVLRGMTQQIATICGLSLFSTEIALDLRHVWQVVDYVNEPCDYRLKSKVENGVPDEVVAGVARQLAVWVRRQTLVKSF